MYKESNAIGASISQSKIAAKHHYRFKYLKSEHWSNLRIAKLASVDACCKNCGRRDLSNDVHHLNYRKLYDVTLDDLVVLCRACHDLAHEALDINREKIKASSDPWAQTKRIIAILIHAREFGVDASFLHEGELGKRVTQFWKDVRKAKAARGVSTFGFKSEIKAIAESMNGSAFPEYKYFLFDKHGERIVIT